MSTIKNTLRRSYRTIRRFYKKYILTPDENETTLYLTDNFHLLSREYSSLNKTLVKNRALARASSQENIINDCLALCKDGNLPDENDIAEFLKDKDITLYTLSFLPFFLSFALIRICEIGLKNNENTVKNVVISIRKLSKIDFEKILPLVSKTEMLLNKDPAGVYGMCDEATKARYRKAIAQKARKENKTEYEIVGEAYNKALNSKNENERHIAFYLDILPDRSKIGNIILISEIISVFILSALISLLTGKIYVGILLFFPIWEIIKTPFNMISELFTQTTPLPRIELNGEIPPDGATAITVSAILPTAPDSDKLMNKLISLRRGNESDNTVVCLLADLRSEKTPDVDADKADIKAAKRVISSLNKKYNGGFVMLLRARIYSPTQREYSGFERKRGAICALCSFIENETDEFSVVFGDEKRLKNSKYVLAVDYDTQIPFGALEKLVSTAIHPLNKAVVSPTTKTVSSGYGIFAPKIETSIESANKTSFSKIMSPGSGINAYNGLSGEKYQDLFSESIFSGKGLIDVSAFCRVMINKFPNQKILSHDILEGIVMRCAFVGDVSFTDSFPRSLDSFLAREHRWMRGDFQNIPFMSIRKKRVTDNVFEFTQRFRLFDNVRRAITPILIFLSLILSCFSDGKSAMVLSIVALISSAAGELFSSVYSFISGGVRAFSRLYASDSAPNALTSALRGFLKACIMPYSFLNSFDAAARTLYRMTVSKKNLLEWTTFAVSDKNKNNVMSVFKDMFALISGVLLIMFSVSPGKIMGLMFLISPLFRVFSAKDKTQRGNKLNSFQRNKIISYAELMWNYYEMYVNEKENMLPPDNVQETPVFSISHRTSPTDIGMYAVSCLGARDLNFIDTDELYMRLNSLMNKIDKLEKYRGNLFNWYETTTLKTLKPRYISLVDSGNLLCSMTTLTQGLYEYAKEQNEIYSLIKRISEFIKKCDISFMYDNKRNLFHIGYDADKGENSDSYYDLLMSEARMTGYFAVASKRVPIKHWGSLGRILVRDGRYAGPVSWTGTMFEYFMPSLFIPTYKNTLEYEGLKFALRCQKKEGTKRKLPYGVSESGYYEFDRELNYLYKANGIQSLALKRNAEDEYTVSPYSTFLAMSVDISGALDNLARLEKLGAVGSCGFYEAVDFTRRRTLKQDFAFVRSYMAHHVGMSIISCVNALCDFRMQKRFMNNEQNAGAKSLLEEKVPTDVRVMKRTQKPEIPKRPSRPNESKNIIIQSDISDITCECTTNSEYSVFTSSMGESLHIFADRSILKKPTADPERASGIFAALREGEKKHYFSPLGNIENYKNYTFEINSGKTTFKSQSDGLVLTYSSGVHSKFPIGINCFLIKNKTAQKRKADLLIYFEPSLLKVSDPDSHPAFNSLFLESEYDKNDRIITFKRSERASDCEASLSCSFSDDAQFLYCADREQVLPHPYGYDALFSSPVDFSSVSADKCCYIKREITLKPGEEKKITFLMSAALSPNASKSGIIKLRALGRITQFAPGMFSPGSLGEIYARKLIVSTYFSKEKPPIAIRAAKKNTLGLDALWSLGISGDAPILCIKMSEKDNVLLPVIRIHSILSKCGIKTEVAVIVTQSDEYNAPQNAMIMKILRDENYTHMLNARNGIFVINSSKTDENVLLALLSCATLILNESGEKRKTECIKINKLLPSNKVKAANNAFCENGFEINKTPPVAWCMPLANKSFGTLVSDASLGFTWAMNSGENKITPWISDSSCDNNSERVIIGINSKLYDAVKGSNAYFAKNKAVYSSIVDNLKLRTEVYTANTEMKKTVSVSVTNSSDRETEYELIYEINVILASDLKYAKNVKTQINESSVYFTNPFNRFFNGFAALHTDISSPDISNSSALFCGLPTDPGHIVIRKKMRLPPRKTEIYKFILTFAKTKTAADKIMKMSSPPKQINELTIQSPDKRLDSLFNIFLPVQILNSRLFGRTGFRQCSGAYGYRDQLQDALGAILLDPSLLKIQIYRCASAQFIEGDVFHWFHILPVKSGIKLFGSRTKCSDDLLWLPYCVCKYVYKTGDIDILKTKLPYINGDELKEDETQRCFETEFGDRRESLYAHCVRAIEHSLNFGSHSLPLIKGGDWNDSFNEVGIKGKGESVWLAMFMIEILNDFSTLAKRIGDGKRAEKYSSIRVELIKSTEEFAWEGDRYLRAFYDSGEPMGSKLSDACKIDILPQAFSVLSGMPRSERQQIALSTAYNELFDKDKSLVKIFSPPFDKTTSKAGYANAYPHGIRENAGQYTHAAVWLADAFFKFGDPQRGYEILRALNPAEKKTSVYKNEPFFLSADVYSADKMYARGGWSLYTGSAGWFYSTVAEDMFGLKAKDGKIKKSPCFPRKFEENRANIEFKQNSCGNAYNPRES